MTVGNQGWKLNLAFIRMDGGVLTLKCHEHGHLCQAVEIYIILSDKLENLGIL